MPSDALRAAVLTSSPALAPFINAYPHGNGAAIDTNRVNYTSPTGTRQTEGSYLVRVQHIFNEKNNAFLRSNIDHANITGPSGALRDQAMTNTSPMNATVQYVHIFTPTLVNEAIIGFNRAWSVAQTAGYLTTNQNVNYALTVSGLTTLTNSKVSESAPSTYSFLDNLTKTWGSHTIKTGVELKDLQFNYSQLESTPSATPALPSFKQTLQARFRSWPTFRCTVFTSWRASSISRTPSSCVPT